MTIIAWQERNKINTKNLNYLSDFFMACWFKVQFWFAFKCLRPICELVAFDAILLKEKSENKLRLNKIHTIKCFFKVFKINSQYLMNQNSCFPPKVLRVNAGIRKLCNGYKLTVTFLFCNSNDDFNA